MAAPPATVCVVVPTYNEKVNVAALIGRVEEAGVPGLLMLFVDDASPDGTAGEVKRVASTRTWVKLLERSKKMGIGSAYQDGFREALASLGPDVLIEMDADLQHPASHIPKLVAAIREGADVAVCSRYVPGGGTSGWGFLRRAVSWGANAYCRLLLRPGVKDTTSGFRAFSKSAAEIVASSELPAKGFEFQVATLHLLKGRAKVVEVPFVFLARSAGRSKLGLADIGRFFVAVLKMAV